MKDFPIISQVLIDSIRKHHPDGCRDLGSLEQLYKRQGQQELINWLQEIVYSQDSKKRGK